MGNKSNQKSPRSISEAWWAALLAEEEKHSKESINEFIPEPDGSMDRISDRGGNQSQKMIDIDWEHAKQLYQEDNSIELEVIGYNRGGLLVSGGKLQGFVPISHLIELTGEIGVKEREAFLSEYIGRQISLKVIECDSEQGRVVFSERAAQAEAGRRNELFDSITNGDEITGEVTNITDFGVFLDLGGVEGLIHVSELSWGRVRHPCDVAFVGEQLTAYVINVDRSRCRIALSLKRLYPNPWETAEERYQAGQIVNAIVTSVVPFGAFARLEEGLDGLIHKSELGTADDNLGPTDLLEEGQEIQVRVLNVDSSRQRLGLSLDLTSN